MKPWHVVLIGGLAVVAVVMAGGEALDFVDAVQALGALLLGEAAQ